jgi:hypothetical protein
MSLKDLSDTPIVPEARPPDPITRARAAARARGSTDGTVLALYRCPVYGRWGVEALANEATNGSLEPAGTTLLEAGMSALQRFPGLAEIKAARQTAVAKGCPDTMHFLGDFPHVQVHTAGTDDSGCYRLHVPKDLAKRLGNMARQLGLPQSRLGIFALMAGLLQVRQLIPPAYRQAMVETLQGLRAAIERRAAEAQARVAVGPPEDAADDGKWTLADVLDQKEVPDGENVER